MTELELRTREIEKSIIKRFRKEIWRPFVRALNDYDMIKEGDNIAVCISGGKDSMLLAKCMQEILRHGKMEFGLKFLVMDPGYKTENRQLIEENAKTLGIPVHIFESDIFDVVKDVKDSPCYL
ncbi:MAG: tRNA 2-thiocytidine biosynthesis protein TtcA, partial [Lachnospiraceae bacterium]|nr:tRNA 2-thiocytidine biosynthesis protein TtcA [Lachnospiraceae bacterium]